MNIPTYLWAWSSGYFIKNRYLYLNWNLQYIFFCVHVTNIISMEFPFSSEIYHDYLGYHNSPGREEACLFISRIVAAAIERWSSLIYAFT